MVDLLYINVLKQENHNFFTKFSLKKIYFDSQKLDNARKKIYNKYMKKNTGTGIILI